VESDIRQEWREKWKDNFERLDGPIQVLVVDGVFIVPHPRIWPCNLVSNEYDPIVARIRLDPSYRRAGPSRNGRLHPHRGADTRKRKIGRAAINIKLAVGDIVGHVALVGMRLAP
jgi:hypothetical protein